MILTVMARMKNPVVDTGVVILAVTVALSERWMVPLLQAGLKWMEVMVSYLEAEPVSMAQLSTQEKQFELVDVVFTEENSSPLELHS